MHARNPLTGLDLFKALILWVLIFCLFAWLSFAMRDPRPESPTDERFSFFIRIVFCSPILISIAFNLMLCICSGFLFLHVFQHFGFRFALCSSRFKYMLIFDVILFCWLCGCTLLMRCLVGNRAIPL